MVISLIYSAGLRIGEAVNLKIEDIDSKNGVYHRTGRKRQERQEDPFI